MLNIQELCAPNSKFLEQGRARIALSSSRAYVWTDNLVQELRIGESQTFESLSARDIANTVGLNFAGQVGDTSVFMSQSSEARIKLPESSRHFIHDQEGLKQAALSCADWLCHVQEIADTAASESAARKVWYTYKGPKLVLDDAHDEYDIELRKGDKFSIAFLNVKDHYSLSFKTTRVKGVLKGHIRALDLIGKSEATNHLGAAADAKDKTFIPIGAVPKKLTKPFAMRKGAVIYMHRRKFYIEDQLAVPLDRILSSTQLQQVVDSVVEAKGAPMYKNGKKLPVPSKPEPPKAPKEHKEISARHGKKRPTQNKAVVNMFAAFFAVSPYQPGRSRVVFAETEAKARDKAISYIRDYDKPVPFSITETTNQDDLFSEDPSAVAVINTATAQMKYPKAKAYKPKDSAASATLPPDNPAQGAPAPTFSVNGLSTDVLYKHLVRLITDGFFISGVSVDHSADTRNGITFTAPSITNEVYDRVQGCARRISMYLRESGVEFGKMVGGKLRHGLITKRGKTKCIIQVPFPEMHPEAFESTIRLEKDPPKLNAPIYELTKFKRPTVVVESYNIHTGKCVVRPQRGNLYLDPLEVYYSELRRKIV